MQHPTGFKAFAFEKGAAGNYGKAMFELVFGDQWIYIARTSTNIALMRICPLFQWRPRGWQRETHVRKDWAGDFDSYTLENDHRFPEGHITIAGKIWLKTDILSDERLIATAKWNDLKIMTFGSVSKKGLVVVPVHRWLSPEVQLTFTAAATALVLLGKAKS